MLDLSPREMVILYPLVVLTIFFGVYPAPILDATAASVEALVNNYHRSASSAAHDARRRTDRGLRTMTAGPRFQPRARRAGADPRRRRAGAADARRLSRRAAPTGSSPAWPSLVLVVAGAWLICSRRARAAPSAAPSSSIAFARFMKVLALVGSAVALVMSIGYRQARAVRQVRVSGADPARARSA